MCGRFAYFGNNTPGYGSLQLLDPPSVENYNVTPSKNIFTLRLDPETKQPVYVMLQWGLLPFWSKIPGTKFSLINAGAEGIDKNPSFRGPFKYRRCVIPASGFYEWKKLNTGKQPYFIKPADNDFFSLAGIWDYWEGENGQVVESCAIITTEANKLVKDIHDRMPVILDDSDVAGWLDIQASKDELLVMLKPCPADKITVYPVTSMVNNPRNNGPECVKRI